MKILKIMLAILLFVCIEGCSNDNSPEIPSKEGIELNVRQKEIRNQGNTFANRLMMQLSSCNENVIVSPFNLQSTISLLTHGADETTCNEILTTMGWKEYSLLELAEYHRKISVGLKENDDFISYWATTSLWLQMGLNISELALNQMERNYFSSYNITDFSNLENVNNDLTFWLYSVSKGRIQQLQIPLHESMSTGLIDLCYFNGIWKLPFNTLDNEQQIFIDETGNTNEITMMCNHSDFPYFENENYQLVEIPYGNDNFSMLILLPRENQNINDILDNFLWYDTLMNITSVDLKLPKMNIEHNQSLKEALESLGMKKLFKENSLSGIIENGNAELSFIHQAISFDVNEGESNLAKITKTTLVDKKAAMTVNRPFVFAIRENSSGILLIMGKIASI